MLKKEESSVNIFQKFLGLAHSNVEVYLKNGRIIHGVIIDFCLEFHQGQPYVTTWHLVDENEKMTLGVNIVGQLCGEFVKTKDIIKIKFLQDQSFINLSK
ncbi:MAG TPA: hypothetical protein PKK64_08285 [Saprospiraceae bacterium]|nr:hypothetical protein [Saprospiraceae bacterium]HNB29569.1 hypothetical protein [Saprospiraceae bacterium]HNC35531.1 hypothetical protein [Saprospiraceae bacterium]HNE62601.1 hypothetical protein [Saprospiraceae bacterium]HNG68694.1 hypothetical protein [Saprospiraceae bacterium]